jgi:hypothetical protein
VRVFFWLTTCLPGSYAESQCDEKEAAKEGHD